MCNALKLKFGANTQRKKGVQVSPESLVFVFHYPICTGSGSAGILDTALFPVPNAELCGMEYQSIH